jgi:hypothetical protein
MKERTSIVLITATILAVSIGVGCAFVFLMQDERVNWTFIVPSYEGATQISTDYDGGFIYPFHDMPYNITGHGAMGQTVHLQVWYYKTSTVEGENISGTPILIAVKEYSFTVTKP